MKRTCAMVTVRAGETKHVYYVRESRFLDFFQEMVAEGWTVGIVHRGLKINVETWTLLSV